MIIFDSSTLILLAKVGLLDHFIGNYKDRILKVPFTSAASILVRLVEHGVINSDAARLKIELLIKYGRYSAVIINQVKNKPKLQ